MTHTSGPVPIKSTSYVARSFERECLRYLSSQQWVLLLGPRQHGKTSALIRLKFSLVEQGFRCCFVDLQALPPNLNFRSLLKWFVKEVAKGLRVPLVNPIDGGEDSLEDWIMAVVPAGAPLVVLVDEASAIQDEEIRNSFYGQIRAIKSSAAANPDSICADIFFLFAGTFRPEVLVDPKNSPFNVCRRIDTDDLSFDEVQSLAKISLDREEVQAISRVIFDGVGGQPHLVQTLLAIAEIREESDEIGAVQAELESLCAHSNDHSDSIFRAVVAEQSLTDIASAVVRNGSIPNDPANDYYRYMIVLGLMRRDGTNLIFRNALYEKIARGSPQLQNSGSIVATQITSHFYPRELAFFAFMTNPKLKEICFASYNGAAISWNAGSYRLTLVGFGIALEAMLIDFLLRQNPRDISSRINAAARKDKPNFNHHENNSDPWTWRLVNLIAVARLINGINGPLEVPEALREMRNFVHPALLCGSYRPESELAPEALAAGGLTQMVIRDIH